MATWQELLVTAGSPSLVGIVGIIGAGRAPRALERRQENREFRRARRLVLEEIHTILLHLELLLEAGTTPTEPDRVAHLFPTDQWQTQMAVLAASLPDGVWDPLPLYLQHIDKQRLWIADMDRGALLPAHIVDAFESSRDVGRDIMVSLGRCKTPLKD